jgi:type IV secretory pathway TrbL component
MYALLMLALVALFVVFITFRGNAALIAALEAAGTVAAAGFAAIAAMGAMRAAAESSAAAKRSREAMAWTVRPRVQPSLSQDNGAVLGTVASGDGRSAVDVTVVWIASDGDPVTQRIARLDAGSTVDVMVPEAATLNTVWIEYWDDGRAGHWRDTWEAKPEAGLVLTHSELVD